jgi:hypothetical protein
VFHGRMRAENFMNILNALKKEHAHLVKNLERIAAAIAALRGKHVKRKKRRMSAAARRKISATQKANWRKKRAGK